VQNDFPDHILELTAHRPWPMPSRPWIMTQSWHDLLFAHWPVDAGQLRSLLPAGLSLDLYDGQAWVGIVPFEMTNVAPRGVPALPLVSAFLELNVRTYVTMQEKPGIYFFSLDADSTLAVTLARTLFGLPYFGAEMEVRRDAAGIHFRSARVSSPAEFVAHYRAAGPVFEPMPGTLDDFLTERYCLYTVDDSFKAHRLEIHHPPWQLQAAEAVIDRNTMAEAAGIRLAAMSPMLHFVKRQDMVAFPMETLT
jgi:uncharacterized protein